MFKSEAYKLQNNTTIDRQIITSGELFVKAQYFCSMQEITNSFLYQHPYHQFITVPTCTIFHPRLDVNEITNIHAIPKIVCNSTQAKKSI